MKEKQIMTVTGPVNANLLGIVYSHEHLIVQPQISDEKYIPYIIDTTYGLDSTVLAVLFDAYNEEILEDGTTREVLKLHPYLAPYKLNVLPLIDSLFSEVNPIPVKYALNELGFNFGVPRLPLVEFSDTNKKVLRQYLKTDYYI